MLLMAPRLLCLEHPQVHRLKRPLLGGGFHGDSCGLGVGMAREREVARDEGDPVAVLAAELLHERVYGATGLTLEVEELNKCRVAGLRLGESVAVLS